MSRGLTAEQINGCGAVFAFANGVQRGVLLNDREAES